MLQYRRASVAREPNNSFVFQARKVSTCTTTTATTTRPLLETSHQLFKLNGEENETRHRLEHANMWEKKVETQPCSTRRTQSLQQFPSYISLAQKMLLPNKQAHRQNKLRRHVTAIGEAGRGKYKSSSVNKWSGGGAGGKRGRLLTGHFNMVTSVKCDSLALLRVDHGCLDNWKSGKKWDKIKQSTAVVHISKGDIFDISVCVGGICKPLWPLRRSQWLRRHSTWWCLASSQRMSWLKTCCYDCCCHINGAEMRCHQGLQ